MAVKSDIFPILGDNDRQGGATGDIEYCRTSIAEIGLIGLTDIEKLSRDRGLPNEEWSALCCAVVMRELRQVPGLLEADWDKRAISEMADCPTLFDGLAAIPPEFGRRVGLAVACGVILSGIVEKDAGNCVCRTGRGVFAAISKGLADSRTTFGDWCARVASAVDFVVVEPEVFSGLGDRECQGRGIGE